MTIVYSYQNIDNIYVHGGINRPGGRTIDNTVNNNHRHVNVNIVNR